MLNKHNIADNQIKLKNNTRSLLLVVDDNSPHKDRVISFLKQQEIVNPKQPQTDLNWFNQEEESLKIKQVRSVIEQTSYGSYSGQQRVFVLLHADNSSIPAQNALLKIIEEPPENTLMILTVAQPQQLLPTILSRCIRFNLKQHQTQQLSKKTAKIARNIVSPEFNYDAAITLAQDFKKRDAASNLTHNLLLALYQQLQDKNLNTQERNKVNKCLQLLLEAYSDLHQNLNPQLTLEHYFFRIIKL